MSMVDLKSSGNQFAHEQQSIVPGAASSHTVSDVMGGSFGEFIIP
jgi:hypothetical protein